MAWIRHMPKERKFLMTWSHLPEPRVTATTSRSTDLVPFAHVLAPLSGIGDAGYLVTATAVRLVARCCSLIGTKLVARLHLNAGRSA